MMKSPNCGTMIFLLALLTIGINFNVYGQFAKGADVSWLSEMEASGFQWYNGNQEDLFK